MAELARKHRVGHAARLALLAGLAIASPAAHGQPGRPGPGLRPPEVAPAVLRAVEAQYLTAEERKDLRVFHGLWLETDLDTPARRAAAALMVGAWDHPWLLEEDAPVLDRAEAMIRRGELDEALEILAGEGSLRSLRLRADALESLGRMAEADAALDVLVDRMARVQTDSAAELTEAVRALIARSRLRGPGRAGDAASDYRTLAALLARARDDLDRLHWPAYLAEAALLLDKDNLAQGSEALAQAAALCPATVDVLRLLGRASVASFDFVRAEFAAGQATEQYRRLDPEGVAPEAVLILARARLRQGDPDEALRLLGPMLERFPGHREALALRAAAAAGLFDFDRARALCEAFDQLSPGSPLAYLEVGERLSDLRQYDEAAWFLDHAATRQPNWSRPRIALGLLEMQTGRDAAARAALTQAVALDPFNVRARNSLRLAEELLTYDTVESENFVVRFRPGIDRALALDMPEILERIHARVTGAGTGGIDHEPERRTIIELMPDHAWFSVRITGLPAIHTVAASTGPVIAMESPQVGAGHSLGLYDWPRVLQHEYAHTVTLSRTRNRIPHWFTEAAAVYLEDAPRDHGRWLILARAVETGGLFALDEIDLMFVRPRQAQDRAQAYAQGHWMYEFIVERWGARAPLDLMDRFADGLSIDAAFREVLGVDSPAAFMHAFRPWAEAQLRAVGMLLPDGVPGLGELFERDVPPGGRRPDRPSADQLRSWLAEHPGHPEVLRELAHATVESDRGEATERSIPLLLDYARARPADDFPHRALARLLLRTPGREHEAIPHLEFLDAREQASPVYAAALAHRYAAADDMDRAATKAERATWIAPFDADHRELAARVALVRGDLAGAERHIHALTIIEPDREAHRLRLDRVRQMRAGN